MSENLSDLAGKLIINGVQIKKLLIDGSIIFDKDGEHSKELVIQGYKIKKLILDGVPLFSEGYKQKWSDDPVPTASGFKNLEKIPLDSVNVIAGMTFIEISHNKFEYIKGNTDAIQATGGLCDVTVTTVDL